MWFLKVQKGLYEIWDPQQTGVEGAVGYVRRLTKHLWTAESKDGKVTAMGGSRKEVAAELIYRMKGAVKWNGTR